MRYYVGIDPGAKGGVAIIDNKEKTLSSFRIQDDNEKCTLICEALKNIAEDATVAIEDLHALWGASASSTFTFGLNVGFWHGVCNAFSIPFKTITPCTWQEAISHPPKRTYISKLLPPKTKRALQAVHKAAIKAASITAANKIFPTASITHDGVADAVCIAEYLRLSCIIKGEKHEKEKGKEDQEKR